VKCIKRKNKKGDLTDSLAFVVTIGILAIGLFVMAFIIPQITSGLNSANLNSTTEGASAINQIEDYGLNGIQKGFFFLFIGLCIAEIISAFYIDTHPIWLFMYIIFLGLSIVIGAYLGNAYEQLILNSAFTGFSQGLIDSVMSHIVRNALIVGAISMVVAFSKWAFFNSGQRI
jgi:hypothetical protein